MYVCMYVYIYIYIYIMHTYMYTYLYKGGSYSVLFVEAVCDDGELLEANMRDKAQSISKK